MELGGPDLREGARLSAQRTQPTMPIQRRSDVRSLVCLLSSVPFITQAEVKPRRDIKPPTQVAGQKNLANLAMAGQRQHIGAYFSLSARLMTLCCCRYWCVGYTVVSFQPDSHAIEHGIADDSDARSDVRTSNAGHEWCD